MKQGLIIYGPPASGKDTITAALVAKHPQFEHFKRLKSGGGRTSGYRMISEAGADALRKTPGAVLWENSRYGATYFVERSGLEQMWQSGRMPVVHLGQVAAIDALRDTEAQWTVVELYASPVILHSRIRSRSTGDDDQRFAAIEQTPRLPTADMRIDTGVMSIAEAAEMIARFVQGSRNYSG
ncbi:kinase [Verrucosispora sp. NA02020]|uniref:kinase n=1 Tax=Verrucosispora sp. NA02020 TaxID=2742132 RepID=UPI003D733D8D